MIKKIVQLINFISHYTILSTLPKHLIIKFKYFIIYKRAINFKSPKHFSEFLSIKKISIQKDLEIKCCDKQTVKEYLSQNHFDHLIMPSFAVVSEIKDIQWNQYQKPYIVKVSNASGWNMVIRRPSDVLVAKVKFYIYQFLDFSNSQQEICYAQAPRTYIVEPLLSKERLNDFKVYCFMGKPKFLQINDHTVLNKGRVMIDENLNYYPFPFASGQESAIEIRSRPQLKKMFEISEILSSPFSFVRVDFYLFEDELKVGEMTFYPMAGYMLRNSQSLDQEWMKYLSV